MNPNFTNSTFPSSLLQTIAKATSHQPLVHFHPPAPTAAPVPPPSVRQVRVAGVRISDSDTSPPLPLTTLLVIVAVVLLALICRELTLLLARGRQRQGSTGPFRPSRGGILGVAGLAVAVAVVSVQTASFSGRTATAHPSQAPAPTANPARPDLAAPVIARSPRSTWSGSGEAAAPPPTAPIWLRLVGVEAQIESSVPSSNAPLTLSGVQDRAGRDAALAAEEAVYEEAARDPGTAAVLVDAATRSGDAEAISAVNTDLAIVRSALADAAAADTARQTLIRLGTFSTQQLDAMSSGAPLITPMVGSLSQLFGPTDFSIEPSHTFDSVWYPHFHTGVDLAASAGTPVHAAADGVVLVAGASTDGAGRFVGFGQYVVIQHPNGFTTLYGHLQDMSIHEGDRVLQGEIIGHEGSTGNSTGPHLHFEIRIDGEPVDPLPYIARSR